MIRYIKQKFVHFNFKYHLKFQNLQNLIRAAEVADIIPIVRTYDSSETAISKALDLGAKGIQVPQIQSVEEAENVVKAAKYFPKGQRGVCRFVRAANYSSTPRNEYFEKANVPNDGHYLFGDWVEVAPAMKALSHMIKAGVFK